MNLIRILYVRKLYQKLPKTFSLTLGLKNIQIFVLITSKMDYKFLCRIHVTVASLGFIGIIQTNNCFKYLMYRIHYAFSLLEQLAGVCR